MLEICNDCQSPKLIQNKKYGLCGDCVFKRNHGGKSQTEIYMERALEKAKKEPVQQVQLPKINTNSIQIKKSVRKKRTKTIQQIRSAEISKELSELKALIRREAIENDQYYCEGCGQSHVILDCSHVMSVGRFKRFELERQNVRLLCRSCHLKHESNDMKQMTQLFCFNDDMLYIKSKNILEYNRLEIKLEEYQEKINKENK